jgi:hypothetical protein
MVAWRCSLEDGFSSNFDGYDKIMWRLVMRNRAAACLMIDWFVSIGLEKDTIDGLSLLFIDMHGKGKRWILSHKVLASRRSTMHTSGRKGVLLKRN